MKNKNYPLYNLLPEINSLNEMLELANKTRPNAVAFRYMTNKINVTNITFGEFYNDVLYLATYILKKGAHNRKIAIIGENSYQWLVTYFAIVTSGNIAVLVPKDSTDAEISTLLFQSDAEIVVVSENLQRVIDNWEEKFIKKKLFFSFKDLDKALEKGKKLVEKGKNLTEKEPVDIDKPATIFFTSGTSGISKGVVLSQRNMASNINQATKNFKLEGPTLAVLPFTHAFGLVTATFMPFHYAQPTFINSGIPNFMKEIPIAKPKTLFLVPLFVETFSKTIWRTAEKQGQAKTLRTGIKISNALLKAGIDKRKKFFGTVLSKFGGNLESIICGGAPLDPMYVKEFRSLGIEILNGYGITECSPVLAVNRMYFHRDGSVGQILKGCDIKIANPDRKGIGEIIVKGHNVMLGYYKDEKSTCEVFTNDGWFRTGDLGYIDKDGFLFITGRAKNLIILANGENVSPEEIEQYIARIPEVKEVIVYEDNNKLTAEIVPEESELLQEQLAQIIEEKVRKACMDLPNHKHVNRIIVRSTEFEKTSTQKIKRYKLGLRNK